MYGGGGESNSANVSDNSVTADSGTFNGIVGGMSSTGTVSDNRVFFNGGTVYGGIVGGSTFFSYGSSESAGDVIGNVVNINGGTVGYVSGGEVGYLYPISSGGIPDITQSYFLQGGNAIGNTVNISGGTITGGVIGGSSFTGAADGNIVNIGGGTISGEIIGGEVRYNTSNASAANNVVNILGSPNLSGAYLYGGMIAGNANATGNSLNIYTSGISVRSISGFDSLNFFIPNSAQSGDTILRVTSGRTDLTSSTINASIWGDSKFTTGDTFNLVHSPNGLSIGSNVSADLASSADVTSTLSGVLTKGVSLDYSMDLAATSDGRLTATVGSNLGLKQSTEAFPETQIVNVAVINAGSDRLVDWIPSDDLEFEDNDEDSTLPSDDAEDVEKVR